MTNAKDHAFKSVGKEFTPTYNPSKTAKQNRKQEIEEMSRKSIARINKKFGKGLVKKRIVIVDEDLNTHTI